MTKLYKAKITLKGVFYSTYVTTTARNAVEAKKAIVAQYANGDDKKITFHTVPFTIK